MGNKNKAHSLVLLLLLMNTVQSRLSVDKLSSRIVTTTQGKLRGVLVEYKDEKLQPVEAYLGIEYGSLHGGRLRFMPPTNPVEKWEGVKIANSFKPVCPQNTPNVEELHEQMPKQRVERLKAISLYTKLQSEDCLYLNIYVPARERKGPAPVVVYIHGESYEFGTGNAYDGSVLSSHADVVVVTLNYRLGVLGFLSTGDSVASGNYALFDLVAALHWIQTNIADFGGDSSRVTVMAHEYGAVLASLLSLSPVTKRLSMFNRLILMSGSPINPWAMAKHPAQTAKQLGAALNCKPSNQHLDNSQLTSAEIVACLRTKPVEKLAEIKTRSDPFTSVFGPVVDRVLVEEDPRDLFLRDDIWFAQISIMFGVSKHEGAKLLAQKYLDKGLTEKEKSEMLSKYVSSLYKSNRNDIKSLLNGHYYKHLSNNDSYALLEKMTELLADGQFNIPALEVGSHHLRNRKDTYFYVFSHLDSGLVENMGGQYTDELAYIFGTALVDSGVAPFEKQEFTKAEKVLSEACIRFFGNFINSGNPNIPLSESPPPEITAESLRFMDVYWPRYVDDTQQYLHLGTRPLVNHHYKRNRYQLWTEVIPKLAKKEDTTPIEEEEVTGEIINENTSKVVDVRHVIPPPPTPPIIPPYRENSNLYNNSTKQVLPNDSSDDAEDNTNTEPDKSETSLDIGAAVPVETVTRVRDVTRIIKVYRYENVTQLVTKQSPVQQKDGFSVDITLAVTLGVGCALLFLNFIILIGVCCQRSKLRTERKALTKLDQTNQTSARQPPATNDIKDKPINILENHLYEKAMDKFHQQQQNSANGTLETHRSAALVISTNENNNPSSPRIPMRGIPEGPARSPSRDMYTDDMNDSFTTCNNYKGGNSTGHQTLPPQSPRGYSTNTPPPNSRRGFTPIPSQRSQTSLHRMAMQEEQLSHQQGRRLQQMNGYGPQSPNNTPRQNGTPQQTPRMAHTNRIHEFNNSYQRYDTVDDRIEESPYKTPRRFITDDGVSSGDSGIQHMSYDFHNQSTYPRGYHHSPR